MGHAYPAYDLKISPDDSVVYIASSKLLRFHLPDWAPLPSLVGHTGTVTQLALSRDGHRLVSGAGTYTGLVTADGTTRIDCIQ